MNVPLHISVDKLLQLGKSSNPESVKFSQSLVWDFIAILIMDQRFTGEMVQKTNPKRLIEDAWATTMFLTDVEHSLCCWQL